MTIAIMQPYFFPYIGYWQLINAVDTFVILDDVNFIKKGWIHKNFILMKNERRQINLEIVKASQNKLINELVISGSKWKDDTKNKIKSAYKNAPNYEKVFPWISQLLDINQSNLSAFLTEIIRQISSAFGLSAKIFRSSLDFPKGTLSGQSRIIDICKQNNCTNYINAIGGKDLYQPNTFKENGIELNFIETKEIHYKQFSQEFETNLSIIDILMFNDFESIKTMLDNYKLTKY